MNEIRISVDLDAFRRLSAGHVVPFEREDVVVLISLQDIGWKSMHDAVPSGDYDATGVQCGATGFWFRCAFCKRDSVTEYGSDRDQAQFRARQESELKGWKLVNRSSFYEDAMMCEECIQAGF